MLIRKEKSGKYGVYCWFKGYKKPLRAGIFDTFEEANAFFIGEEAEGYEEKPEKALDSPRDRGENIINKQ